MVATTGQPYAFTGDDPLNSTDPLGLKRFAIQQYARGYAKTVDITPKQKKYIQKHAKEIGVSQTVFVKAVLDTLRRPEDIKVQPGNHTLLYSGPIALTIDNQNGQATIVKKFAFFVSIDQSNGRLVTAYQTTQKVAVAKAWDNNPWVSRIP